MVATTTPPINKLFKQIKTDFPAYRFTTGTVFYWSPQVKEIQHPDIRQQTDIWTLLHEIAHAELLHKEFTQDIQLVDQEVAAWEYAKTKLAGRYGLRVDEDHVQDHLDTYRVWMHSRSICPQCGQNGLQNINTYSCSNCRCLWRVNDARMCQLKRTKLQAQNRSS